MLAGICVHPIETIRKRAIVKSEGLEVKNILKNEGMRSLFKGVGLTPVQSLAAAGILLYFDKDWEWWWDLLWFMILDMIRFDV